MAKKDKKTEKAEKESMFSEIGQKFRQNPALYIGSVFILLLVSITFLAGDILFRRADAVGDLTFGYYDKAPITWMPGNMFAQYQDQALRFYQSQGIDINNLRTAADIWRQSYEMTVTHVAVLQMMKRSGYAVPERVVDRQVAQLPHFQENGRFSAALYNQMPETSRTALWRQVQEELTKIMFFSDYYNLLIPETEADFIGSMVSNMRNFEMVSLRIDNYPEDEYLIYANEKADLFRTIHLSRITVHSSEREAGRILDSIRNGTITFEDAARAQSQDNFADRGGDMGIRYSFELEVEIPNSANREVIFNLGRGEISSVIQIGDGWAFFRVEETLKPADFDDPAVMERVRSYLRNYDRGRMEDWALAQARSFIDEANESGFDNAAIWWNLEKQSFGPLPVNCGGLDLFPSLESFSMSGLSQQEVQLLARSESFWRIAFSTPLNTPSQPMVHGGNVLVLFPIEQVEAEESYKENIASIFSSYWANYIAEQSIQYYFLNNPRMDDRFWETYFRYFMP